MKWSFWILQVTKVNGKPLETDPCILAEVKLSIIFCLMVNWLRVMVMVGIKTKVIVAAKLLVSIVSETCKVWLGALEFPICTSCI